VILDSSEVSLADWGSKPAIEVYPGAKLASPAVALKGKPVKVVKRTITTKRDMICLLLSNRRTLQGTADQKVCIWKAGGTKGIEMRCVKIGQKLTGAVDGVKTLVTVTGLMHLNDREERVVDFEIDGRHAYVAEGVWCLS